MSRRAFYAWVDQANRETGQQTADDPHRWAGTDEDLWWQEARRKRDEQRAR